MRLNKVEKQKKGVEFVSNYLKYLECDYSVGMLNPAFDIYLPEIKKYIKVFCNFSRTKSIKIPGDFETSDEVLYVVVTPTNKNNLGFCAVGGNKKVIDEAIQPSSKPNYMDDLEVMNLKQAGIKSFISIH